MNVLIITLLIVILDQVTKLYVKGISIPVLGIEFQGMPYQSSIPVFGNFFKITFIENPGMAFGLQIGGKLFLSLFTVFATFLLLFFLYKNRKEGLLLRLSLALILGGAIGNLIDRVFYGKIYDYAPLFYGRVVDFLHFDFPNFTIFGKTIYSWPIFNVADISVTFGFLMILLGYKKIFADEAETADQGIGGQLATEAIPSEGAINSMIPEIDSPIRFRNDEIREQSASNSADNGLEKDDVESVEIPAGEEKKAGQIDRPANEKNEQN